MKQTINIDGLERELTDVKTKATALFESQAKKAEGEERERTADEKTELEALLVRGRELKTKIEGAKLSDSQRAEIARLTEGMADHPTFTPAAASVPKSIGQQLIESDIAGWLKAGGHRRQGSQSPSLEFMGTTLDSSSGSGGPLIQKQVLPGIVPLLFRRVTVSDLIAPGTTESNLVEYLKEKTFTNAAAPVLETGVLPESTLVFEATSDQVKDIAHWLPITNNMLDDFPQVRSFVDERLDLGLDLVEEDQVLNGSGTGAATLGIRGRTGVAAAVARGSDTSIDAIFKQMMAIFASAFVQPDGVVVHPTNWQTIQLSKDTTGRYLGTGPWAGPQTPVLWGAPVAVTPVIAVNTGHVGAFRQCAQLFRRGGTAIDISNSHSDFFVKRLNAIRAVRRAALAVYRPGAFGDVTGLN